MSDKEVYAIIEKALNEAMPKIEDYEEGDLLLDWGVVVYCTNPDPEKKSGTRVIFNDDLPGYRARGLLATGLWHLNQPETTE